jgi:hypothetical protein
MAYSPITDFLALLRNTGNGVRTERTPGLDFVVAALARAGIITLVSSATAPTTNQSSTVWFLPSSPSWVAEGTVLIFNTVTAEYEPATPALWSALLGASGGGGSGYNFQSAPNASNTVAPLRSLVAIQRIAPGATTLLLPSVTAQAGKPLSIADYSTGVTNHAITLTPQGTSLIMQSASWELLSTAAQLAGVTLYPSIDLNAWVIAP